MGLGFLSKYTGLFQLLSWLVFFALWKPARPHLRRPGPYLALLINLLCTLPVLVWNQQHGWITVTHVAERGGAGQTWHPTLRYLGEFLGSEAGLLNPFSFFPAVWAAVAFWRHGRNDARMVFFFSMGAPLFLFYTLFTLWARALPNWIAPSVIPLFCLSLIYWEKFLRTSHTLRILQTVGIILGLTLVVVLHDTNLIGKMIGHPLPAKIDPPDGLVRSGPDSPVGIFAHGAELLTGHRELGRLLPGISVLPKDENAGAASDINGRGVAEGSTDVINSQLAAGFKHFAGMAG